MPDIEDMKKTVFFVTRIGEQGEPSRLRSDDLMQLLITPVLSQVAPSLRLVRSDHLAPFGEMTPQIRRHLEHSAVVIADATGLNPNVFFEIGYRHANGKPIIHMIDDPKNIPFDTKDWFHLIVPGEGPPAARDIERSKIELLEALQKALRKPIVVAEAEPPTPHGPLMQVTVSARVQVGGTPLSADETAFLRSTVLRYLMMSKQVKEPRSLDIDAAKVSIGYIGSEGRPRTYWVLAEPGNLLPTLNAFLLEFGLYDSHHENVEEELREAGLT